MPKTITITVPDDAYRSLERAAAEVRQTPEELAAHALTERFCPDTAQQQAASSDPAQARDAILRQMRASGHLATAPASRAHARQIHLPPNGSAERARLEEEIAQDLGDAFQRSGLSLPDLVERR